MKQLLMAMALSVTLFGLAGAQSAPGSKSPADVKPAVQAKPPVPINLQAVPHLSTAERIALQSCEKAKADAQKEFQEAAQQEQAILVEFTANHPGYHLNGTTFTVERDQPKAVQPALPAKK